MNRRKFLGKVGKAAVGLAGLGLLGNKVEAGFKLGQKVRIKWHGRNEWRHGLLVQINYEKEPIHKVSRGWDKHNKQYTTTYTTVGFKDNEVVEYVIYHKASNGLYSVSPHRDGKIEAV